MNKIKRIKHYLTIEKDAIKDEGYDVYYKSGKVKTYSKYRMPNTIQKYLEKVPVQEVKEFTYRDKQHKIEIYY